MVCWHVPLYVLSDAPLTSESCGLYDGSFGSEISVSAYPWNKKKHTKLLSNKTFYYFPNTVNTVTNKSDFAIDMTDYVCVSVCPSRKFKGRPH